jgi:hypothetical protein
VGASRDLDFSEYFAARVQRFRRVAFALCGDWHEAEDLVQAMFVQLYRRWRRAPFHLIADPGRIRWWSSGLTTAGFWSSRRSGCLGSVRSRC